MWALAVCCILLTVPPSLTTAAGIDSEPGVGDIRGECDPQQGPAGHTACLRDEATGKLQWFSCASDTYVRAKSRGTDQCPDGRSYCPYGCLDEAPLAGTDSCECPALSDGYRAVDSGLSAWCYDAMEADQACLWYRQCLGVSQSCEDAVAYGERWCNLGSAAARFSPRAADWVQTVGRCLRAALVPLLRPWQPEPDCQQIRDVASASYKGCYQAASSSAAGATAAGLCKLNLTDWMPVFWTARAGLLPASGTAALAGLAEAATSCKWQLGSASAPLMRWLRLRVDARHGGEGNAIAPGLAGELARALRWEGQARTLQWFCYAVSRARGGTHGDFNLLLVDKLSLGLTTAPDAPLINLTDTVRKLMSSVANGDLGLLRLADEGGINATVLSVTECQSIGCLELAPLMNDPSNSTRWRPNLPLLWSTLILYTLLAHIMLEANP